MVHNPRRCKLSYKSLPFISEEIKEQRNPCVVIVNTLQKASLCSNTQTIFSIIEIVMGLNFL